MTLLPTYVLPKLLRFPFLITSLFIFFDEVFFVLGHPDAL